MTPKIGVYYHPFGLTMTGRSWQQNSNYRFGFQGQEQDQELYDGAVSYKYRVHDPRIGRFLSIDPLAPKYPHNSPYAFSENRVIDGVEIEGLEWGEGPAMRAQYWDEKAYQSGKITAGQLMERSQNRGSIFADVPMKVWDLSALWTSTVFNGFYKAATGDNLIRKVPTSRGWVELYTQQYRKAIIEGGRDLAVELILEATTAGLIRGGGKVVTAVFKGPVDPTYLLRLPKGSRPKPSTYLDADYISNHLGRFDNGASYLTTKNSLDDYGRELVGRPDGQFVLPTNEMDELLEKTGGDIAKIEIELGIPEGAWQGKEIVRIDVPKPQNVRLPSGNEAGANDLWLPGGMTPAGYSEAVIDQIPAGKYTESPLTRDP